MAAARIPLAAGQHRTPAVEKNRSCLTPVVVPIPLVVEQPRTRAVAQIPSVAVKNQPCPTPAVARIPLAAVKNRHVLDAAYNYGIISIIATIPLFGGAAITLATTGTLSIWALSGMQAGMPLIAKILIILGVMGEGIAPFYAAKAELFRAPGAPYVIMIHVSSLLMFLRVVEILLTV